MKASVETLAGGSRLRFRFLAICRGLVANGNPLSIPFQAKGHNGRNHVPFQAPVRPARLTPRTSHIPWIRSHKKASPAHSTHNQRGKGAIFMGPKALSIGIPNPAFSGNGERFRGEHCGTYPRMRHCVYKKKHGISAAQKFSQLGKRAGRRGL